MARHSEPHIKTLHGEPYIFALKKDVTSIERSKRNDLVLTDKWLSRNHAEIRRHDSGLMTFDLKSRNCNYINGTKISRPNDGRTVIIVERA